MPHSEINNPVLLSDGELVVTGPIMPSVTPGIKLVGPVTVRFLLHQKLPTQTQDVIIDDVATWESGPNWEAMIPAARASEIQPGEIRGIGVAILRWDHDPPDGDDPAFETYTWCVRRTVVAQ